MDLDLAGNAEIAEMFGVSRQRVSQLTARQGFPEPVAILAMGKIWQRADVIAWAEATGRELEAGYSAMEAEDVAGE